MTSHNKTRGAALVELAIIFPFFLLLMTLFWDNMVGSLVQVRHWQVFDQLNLVYKASPLKATIVPVAGGSAAVQIKKIGSSDLNLLTDTAIGSNGLPKGFLPKLSALVNLLLSNSGTGSQIISDHDVVVHLVYFDICNLAAGCSGIPLGSVTGWNPVGIGGYTNELNLSYYTIPGGKGTCGPIGGPIMNEFQTWVASKITEITTPSPHAPIGTLVVKVPQVFSNPSVDVYSSFKPVAFLRLCTKAPKFISSKVETTDAVFFFDKDVGF